VKEEGEKVEVDDDEQEEKKVEPEGRGQPSGATPSCFARLLLHRPLPERASRRGARGGGEQGPRARLELPLGLKPRKRVQANEAKWKGRGVPGSDSCHIPGRLVANKAKAFLLRPAPPLANMSAYMVQIQVVVLSSLVVCSLDATHHVSKLTRTFLLTSFTHKLVFSPSLLCVLHSSHITL